LYGILHRNVCTAGIASVNSKIISHYRVEVVERCLAARDKVQPTFYVLRL